MMRDLDTKPYSADEQRVAKFFFDRGTGGGDDPIGAMLAGYAYIVEERKHLRAALKPFAEFAEKAEAFVEARAKDGGSPIYPVNDFRLADFRRAREALSHNQSDKATDR